MRILALDPATKCGWAYMNGGNRISGTWDLSIRRDESAGMRLIRMRSKLNEIFEQGVDLVVYEAARASAPGRQGALVVQASIQSVLQVWSEDHSLPYRGFSPSEIKKFATGKGNANKDAMMAAVRAKFGVDATADDNECDAVALLYLALREYGA